MHKYSDETQRLLKQVCDHFEREDNAVRERQIRMAKKLKYYWDGFQRIWWSEVAHDWRVFDANVYDNAGQTADNSFYDKPVNIFRAYNESIIAALSVSIPSTKCYPDDADNPLDISTARAGDQIAKLVSKHNNVSSLWLHALYIYITEGMIAAYSYTKEDESYGTYEEKEYEDTEVEAKICPVCQEQLADELFTNRVRDEFMPDGTDAELHNIILNDDAVVCPSCGAELDPNIQAQKLIVTRLVGITSKAKTRQCIEVHGSLFVKVANYAQCQADTPYLIYAYETHYANALERYPELKDKLKHDGTSNSTGTSDPYEQWGRLSTQYFGEYPVNNVTVKNNWLRPAAFNILQEDEAADLRKQFPDGVKVVLVNELFADAENEALDDCWTLTQNPLSDYLPFQPGGQILIPIQEITNDLVSLVLQTIEHGIPQTFADPSVLNFEQYRQTEATPGMIFPAKPASGKSIGDAFYEIKTATLSGEILPFTQQVQEAGQLVSGALPSLFGGSAPNSSKTASQYAMSRAQALQRLQTTWKMLSIWWKEIYGKVIPAYIKDVVEDERSVEIDDQGNFINVFIRKAELQGKIGSIELETSEELPASWAQRKDVIMQLMQGGHPLVMEALSSPENIPLVREALGLEDFVIPGENDRQKQFEEIKALASSEPIDMGGQEMPSVEPEMLVDNHELHAEICRNWLVSDAGRLARIENQAGYQNVLLHLQMHMMIIQANAMSAAQEQMSQQQPQQKAAPQQEQGDGRLVS